MLTYCPSCGMNQPTEERTAGSLHQWVCSVCSLVLKDEGAGPEQVLGRVPVQRMSPAELAEARDREAAEKAARAAEQARAALARRKTVAPTANVRPWEQNAIELQELPPSEFVVEMGGEEKVIGLQPPVAVAPPTPAPQLAPAAAPGPAWLPSAGQIAFESGQPRGPASAAPLPLAVQAAAPAPPTAAVTPGALFDRVLVAEDTALLREIVKDSLVQGGISRHVRGCANGEEFLQVAAESVAAGVAIDLAVLDVDMPILNGYFAAIALRAMERGLRARPTPIVFFTAYPCDETFKKVLDHCQPARYLNKGADSSPPRIAARLVQVLASLRR